MRLLHEVGVVARSIDHTSKNSLSGHNRYIIDDRGASEHPGMFVVQEWRESRKQPNFTFRRVSFDLISFNQLPLVLPES